MRKAAQQVAADYGGKVAHVYDAVVGGFAFAGPDDAAQRMQNDPRVRKVESDYTVHTADRPELTSIGAPTAWAANSANQGSGVVVAVLDTGVS